MLKITNQAQCVSFNQTVRYEKYVAAAIRAPNSKDWHAPLGNKPFAPIVLVKFVLVDMEIFGKFAEAGLFF